jgi:hypothetical protein
MEEGRLRSVVDEGEKGRREGRRERRAALALSWWRYEHDLTQSARRKLHTWMMGNRDLIRSTEYAPSQQFIFSYKLQSYVLGIRDNWRDPKNLVNLS